MTTDEAVRLLDGMKSKYVRMENEIYSQKNEALNMAINALERDRWIPCTEKMPEEHDTFFAKFYGTPKWNKNMPRKSSDEVIVTVEYEDGTRTTYSMHTSDGKWRDEFHVYGRKIIAWKPMPDPWKGET